MTLPDSKYYQYLSHMYHEKKLIPYIDYTPDNSWNYPAWDQDRFEKIFLTNIRLIKDQRVLDLGCHAGFTCFISQQLGAKSVTGVNAREYPISVGRHFFKQLNVTNVDLQVADIENFTQLKELCKNHDTIVLASVLEHCRNLEKILSIISSSDIKNIIIDSAIINDDNQVPALYYRPQTTEYDFNAFDGERKVALGARPNRRFLETVLYMYGWKITDFQVHSDVNLAWFSTPKLDRAPTVRDYALISATKFEGNI